MLSTSGVETPQMEDPQAVRERSMRSLAGLRVAIVHYWLVKNRGGEKVVDALLDIFPQADVFALVVDRSSLPARYAGHRIKESWLQHIPGIKKHYRKFVFLAPHALEQFDLDAYDLVISSEAGPTKGVLTRSDTCQVCYCHSPMRYIWELYHQYLAEAPFGRLGKLFFSLTAHYLRIWDYASAARVDYFIANSHSVQARIRKTYRRESAVIHPPVDLESFAGSALRGDFYLVVGALTRYKRVDLAVEACTRLNRPLIVIGEGEERSALQRLAGPSVQFLGFQPENVVREHFQRCRAFLFPGEEDFGMTPVEAQACGRPVVAYARGGALDTVRGVLPEEDWKEGCTGVFFERQDTDALVNALLQYERCEPMFDPQFIRAHAAAFGADRFQERMLAFIAEKYAEFHSRRNIRHQKSWSYASSDGM